MTQAAMAIGKRPSIPLSRIVLPTEHGSWSFLFEPIVVGLAVAFSAAAPWIALMAVGAFFARQPLKTAFLAKRNKGVSSAAMKFAAIFGAAAAVGAAGAALTDGPWVFYPFAVAAPLAIQQIFLDLSTRGRSLLAEITGAVAISSTIAAMALAGGLGWPAAVGLWSVFVCRFIPSILYVRDRLNLEKGKPFDRVGAIGSHVISLAVVVGLAVFGFASWLTVGVFAFLAARCIYGLSEYRVKMRAMQIGVWEVIYGAVTVISIICGYYVGF
jgi:hypothetical protein